MLKIFSHTLLAFLILALTACGGGESGDDSVLIPENINLDNLRIEGYELNFNKDRTGPYEIAVGSDIASLEFRATVSRDESLLYYQLTNSEGETRQIEISSDQAVEISLAEGSNLLKVTVVDEVTLVLISYSVLINRASESAQLSVLQLFSSSGELTLSPAFQPDIYAYTANVTYEDCSYAAKFISTHKDNLVRIEEKTLASNEFFYGNLEPGDNYLDVFVTSGDGARNERYSVTIKRKQPTETEMNKNAQLKKLVIDGKDLDFYCSQKLYAVNVNSNTDSLVLNLTSEVDGIAMYYGDTDIENNEAIEIELADGNSIVQIDTRSLDATATDSYQIYVNRLATNRIYVDDVTELQHALKNANPNDDIRILPGVYAGIADLANSGSTEAAFFSARSGTPLLPIYLSADEPEENTLLQAADVSKTILLIQGDHWVIRNFSLSSGGKGVALDQANSISLSALQIHDVLESGIDLFATNNTHIRDSEISLGNASSQETAALIRVDSVQDNPSTNNEISRNILHNSENNHAIYLGRSASSTLVQNNKIQTSKIEGVSGQLAMVIASGEQTTLRYNSFYPEVSNAQAILADGDTALVYQNIIDRNFSELPLLFSNSGLDILAAENFLSWASNDEDEHDTASYGGNVTQVSKLAPQYRIHLADSTGDCLGLTADEEENALYYVQVKPCGDTTEFLWQFEFSSDRYVYIRNQSVEDGYLMPVPTFIEACDSIESATSITYLADNISGYAQQWAIYQDGESYWFANKFNTAYALTVGGNTYTRGTALVACPWVASERQRFTLEVLD